jgi:hypothetical protein
MLSSQITVETTARDPSTATELILLHAAACELRNHLSNLLPRPPAYSGYIPLLIHSRISARLCPVEQVGFLGRLPLIGVVFGLVGLYLHVEKQFSGHQVQEAHKKLGRRKRQWPKVLFPDVRGSMTVLDVLPAPAWPRRDKAIDDWCESVWNAFRDNSQTVIALLKEYQIIYHRSVDDTSPLRSESPYGRDSE